MPVRQEAAQNINYSFVSDHSVDDESNTVSQGQKDEVKATVEVATKRVKVTSTILVVIALLGVVGSGFHNWTARQMAEKIMNGHHGHRSHGHGHETHTVTRDEFTVYDCIKNLSMLAFFASVCLMIVGKCGFKSARFNKSNFSKMVLKKGKWPIGILFLLALGMGHIGHEMGRVIKRNRGEHHHPHNMTTLEENSEEFSF